MTYAIEVHADAVADLEEAAAWYEAQRRGLGLEFVAEMDRVVANIGEHPLGFSVWNRGDPARRAMASRFPYAMFFDLEPDRIIVMAIAHWRRRPGYWQRRLDSRRGDEADED